MQTGSSLVARRLTARTRAGSPSALKSSAVAAASAAESRGAASGAQQERASSVISTFLNISKNVDMCQGSAEAPRDVVLGPRVGRGGEDLLRRVVLDQLAEALTLVAARDREERGHVRDARGLLHVVRDDHERVLALQVVHQLLDRGGGDRVER